MPSHRAIFGHEVRRVKSEGSSASMLCLRVEGVCLLRETSPEWGVFHVLRQLLVPFAVRNLSTSDKDAST